MVAIVQVSDVVSEYSLPCRDVRSLHILLLLRHWDIPFKPIPTQYPYNSLTGSLPTLLPPSPQPHTPLILSYNLISPLLKPSSVSPSDLLHASAITSTLFPVWDYELYSVDSTFQDLTAPLHTQHIIFPLSNYFALKLRANAQSAASQYGLVDHKAAHCAALCMLNNLEKILETQSYISGDNVGAADTALTSLLVMALCLPIRRSTIKHTLLNSQVLKRYLSKTIALWFPEMDVQSLMLNSKVRSLVDSQSEEDDESDAADFVKRQRIRRIVLSLMGFAGMFILIKNLSQKEVVVQ